VASWTPGPWQSSPSRGQERTHVTDRVRRQLSRVWCRQSSPADSSSAMDSEPLYCAEQIKVPDALPEVLKEWTKEVIRAQPADINAFSAE
jgi:hypothetical protein